jgi:TonB-linked SusC/RagA family outer membrane protein
LGFTCGYAEGYAQAFKVDLNLEEQTLEKAFDLLRQQTNLVFFFSNREVNLHERVNVSFANAELEVVLKELLGRRYSFRIVDDMVLIRPAVQTRELVVIKGTVTDERKNPLPGVTIQLKETSLGTTTNPDGEFTLTFPATLANPVLRFSFVGYVPREVKITDNKPLAIILEEEVREVEEVVVTGIFNRRAESFTGSAVTITAEELRRVGNTNVIQSLKNLDPSFRVVENLAMGSNPNVMPEIRMRGQSGFPDLRGEYATNPNLPLFIVDGFEASLTKVIDMEMSRIATVTLLKDAAAKAIYGSKAANGVVVIETKRPESGKLRLTYSGTLNVNLPDLTSYDLCNAAEKLQVEKNGGIYDYLGYNGVVYWTNPNQQYTYTEQYNTLLKEASRGVNTDWTAQPLRNVAGHKQVVYIEGGDKLFQYGIDFSYNDVKGVMKGSDRQTISGGLKFSYRYESLLLRDELTVVYNKGVNSPWGSFSEYTSMNPYFRPRDEDGNLIKSYSWAVSSTPVVNPMWNASIRTKDFSEYTQLTNNFYAEYRPTEDLRFTARLGLTRTDNGAEVFHPASHTDFTTYTTDELMRRRGTYSYSDGFSFTLSTDVNASYTKYLGKNLLIANVGWNLSNGTTKSMSMTAEGFPNDNLDDIGFARAYYLNGRPASSESTTRDIGVIGALNYSYDDRYLFDASTRFSGSSQFGSENRWGRFWSLGIGWNLHHEAFMQSLEWLTRLKLRASTGFTGSQNFSSYQSQSTWTYYTDAFYDGSIGTYLLGLANERLKWQRKKDTNVGMDFTAFKNRISVKVDYYLSTTDDLQTDVSLPPSTGFASYKENLGKVQNRGYEVYVNARVYNDAGKGNYANVYVNATHNDNQIKAISNALAKYNEEQTSEVTNRPVTRYEEGQSMNAIWAVPSRGIDPATGQDVFVTRDGNTTFAWDPGNLAICGDTEATVYGTCGFNLGYRGFIVNLGMNYQFGGQIYNQTLVDKVENADLTRNVDRRIFSDRWVKAGDVSRFKNIADNSTTRATGRFVEDNDVWTLSSVNVSYDFDRFLAVKRAGVSRLRLSFDMSDVARASSVRIERGTSYPFARAFSFSLQAVF